MRYVDEFRDPEKAKTLLKEIAGLSAKLQRGKRRPLQIMEVCGGHTHAIFRYGIGTMLPDAVELVHGPGCPVCVLPMGRVDDCVKVALKYPEVIFATFGDAMRVPGSTKSLLQAKSEGADVRMVYSPLDSLRIARENPDREVVFFALGFETTMPSTAMTVLRAEAEGITNFSLFCNHITIIPTVKAILDSPELELDGFLGPGHVSMVIGNAPYKFIAEQYGKPIVVAGFEPLDVLHALWMVLKQLDEGRSEVENQYARVVPDAGLAAIDARCHREGVRVARILRMARPRLDRPLRRADAQGLRGVRCRDEVRHSLGQDRRPEIMPVRRSPQGRDQTLGMQGIRHGLHA